MSMLGGGTFSTAEIRFEPSEVATEADRLVTSLSEVVLDRLGRRGGIVWISGGLDAAVVATLCARALGKERVLGLLMEHDETPPELALRARRLTAHLQIPTVEEPLTPALTAIGYQRRRDAAIRTVIPEFGDGWRYALGAPALTLTARAPDGTEHRVELSVETYFEISAAAAFPQRLRKTLEYFHADRARYAVIGTTTRIASPNACVKHGDVAADVKPIAHLYTTQLLQLAAQLGLPDELRVASATEQLDACMYAHDHGVSAAEVAAALDLPLSQIERVFHDLEVRRTTARYVHARPILFGGGR